MKTKHSESKVLRDALNAAGADCIKIYANKLTGGGVSVKAYFVRGATFGQIKRNIPEGYTVKKVPLPAYRHMCGAFFSVTITKS